MKTEHYVVTAWITTASEPKPIVIHFQGKDIKRSQDAESIQEEGRRLISEYLKQHCGRTVASASDITVWIINDTRNNWVKVDA